MLSQGVNKFVRKKNFIGLSATKSWEKSRISGMVEEEEEGQKTVGGGGRFHPPVLIGLKAVEKLHTLFRHNMNFSQI